MRINRTTTQKNRSTGFALLLTLIVVSVVLAIGLSLLNITLKQFTLSATARESEIAFHIANAGLECMQYHRNDPGTRTVLLNDDADPGTSAPSLSCPGSTTPGPSYAATNHYLNPGADEYVYNYIYRYNLENDTCIETSMYLIDARDSDDTITRSINEGLSSISCSEGAVCTTIFSRGYNRSCGDLGSIRTVQRELTIQY